MMIDGILDGIRQILENSKYKVVAVANSGKEVLKEIEKNDIDIAILDIRMPEPDGVELTRIICEKYPEIKVLILTMHNNEAYILEIINIGNNRRKVEGNQGWLKHNNAGIGFVLKNKGQEELIKSLDSISNGRNYYGEEILNTLIGAVTVRQKSESKTRNNKENEIDLIKSSLTKREKEVLCLIASGKSTPQISKKLFVANSTVETHRRNLISKCNVENSKELISFAIKNGLDKDCA